jgi:hypothetical protein
MSLNFTYLFYRHFTLLKLHNSFATHNLLYLSHLLNLLQTKMLLEQMLLEQMLLEQMLLEQMLLEQMLLGQMLLEQMLLKKCC